MDPSMLAIGLVAVIGLVLAITGAGGGVLAIPLLVLGLHLPLQQAGPVGLVAVGHLASFQQDPVSRNALQMDLSRQWRRVEESSRVA